MAASDRLRWGVLGTGRITTSLIRPVASSVRNVVSAVASRDRERAAAHAAQYGIPRSFASYEALLADPDIDAVYIALPNHLHAPWTVRALEAGKHVLCEKPLALTVEDVDAIAAASERTGRLAMEAFMYLHHPQTKRLLELVRSGALGELRGMQAAFAFNLTYPNDPRLEPAMGGGALWDVGCYPVSMARRIAGSPPDRIRATAANGPTGVDLTAFGLLDYPTGMTAQLYAGFASVPEQRVQLIGSLGSVVAAPAFVAGLEGTSTVLHVRYLDGAEQIEIPFADPYGLEVENVAAAVLDGAPPELPLAETRDNIATLIALHTEAAQSRTA
ncbi:MAG TPA: Gfo/Idh/MocA family oxidoreductase [Clostridia bacterium]|nr:Gfo/Idh/MocA family oxidoreductase [Clostridia bacterium]